MARIKPKKIREIRRIRPTCPACPACPAFSAGRIFGIRDEKATDEKECTVARKTL
jgi:hypothetical protein